MHFWLMACVWRRRRRKNRRGVQRACNEPRLHSIAQPTPCSADTPAKCSAPHLVQIACLVGDAVASGILVHQAIPAALLLVGGGLKGQHEHKGAERVCEPACTPHPAAAAAPCPPALQRPTWQLPASPQSITFCTDKYAEGQAPPRCRGRGGMEKGRGHRLRAGRS